MTSLRVVPCVLGVVLTGCCPQCFGECSAPTRCGQFLDPWLQDQGGAWISIADVQRLEDLLLDRVHALKDPRLVDQDVQCRRLSSLRVYPHYAPSWTDEWGRRVQGLAYCDSGTIMIGRADTPAESSYTEEALHWLQACRSTVAWSGAEHVDGNAAHANWGADGLWDLILDVRQAWRQ